MSVLARVAHLFHRTSRWLSRGHRATAMVPLVLIAVNAAFGPAAFLTIAGIVPAAIVVLHVIERRGGDGVRDIVTGLPRVEVAHHWLCANLKGRGSAAGMAVMAVSLDEMPKVEEQVSKAMRETMLRDVAGRIGRLIRTDDLLTRGNRSDFLICLNAVSEPESENILQLAQRLQGIMSAPFASGSVTVYCSLSVGVAQVRYLSTSMPENIVAAADAALKQAQSSGPGCYRLHQPIGAVPATTSDDDLTQEFGAALENGQIVGWYQPQISTDTGAITGFEALARWEHPSRGLIAPGSFIDIARRNGLSQRLTEVILTHALSALRAWDKSGLDIPSVAVNFGSEDLRNPGIVDFLRWELDRHDVAPGRLSVEVLEDVIAERHDDIIARNLRALADLGCRIELDDFGTGYTSILNIRRFSVSRIKIDRKLIARIDMDGDQRDLVAALLAMAERLNIETLGEGVETRAEYAMLCQMGCDHVQGFALARPMPLGDSFTWILAHRAEIDDKLPSALRVPTGTRSS